MLPLIGSIIGAGASLIGGMMNNNAQQEANKANIASTEAANEKNYQAQKEFAQNGIRWKMDDANAAGIHPVYAMGAQPMSFAPSYVGSNSQAGSPGDGVSAAGQDIGRAVSSTLTQPERAYNQALQGLQLERAGLENELLRSQIRATSGPAVGSGTPLAGSPGAGSLMFHGAPWDTNPGTSPAQAIEDRYGDLVAALYGAGVIGSDVLYNAPSASGSNAGATLKRFDYDKWAATQRLKTYLTDAPDVVKPNFYQGIY